MSWCIRFGIYSRQHAHGIGVLEEFPTSPPILSNIFSITLLSLVNVMLNNPSTLYSIIDKYIIHYVGRNLSMTDDNVESRT